MDYKNTDKLFNKIYLEKDPNNAYNLFNYIITKNFLKTNNKPKTIL